MQVPLSIADELIGSYGKRASKQVQVGHVPLRDRRLQVLARLLRDEIVKREAHLRPKGRDDSA